MKKQMDLWRLSSPCKWYYADL